MKSLVLLAPLLFASLAPADIIITLTDGSTVQGSFKHTPDGYVVTKADGTEQLVPDSQVKGLKPTSSATPASGGTSGLDSLRRATANSDDVSQIIKRYRAFIAQNPGTPVTADAEKDLALWQDRSDKKMVKAGGNWITQADFDKLKSMATETAIRVAPMITAGKLKEASVEVDRSLAIAPTNPDLQYLKGIIAYKQTQLGPARTAFQAAGQEAPSHGPSHNNAAVALAKTRAPMPALAEFQKAMESLPNNQTVLDNVAEVLHSLPSANQNASLTKRVVETFTAQDAVLQRKMATMGRFRWGSQWLDQAEYAVVQAEKKSQQDKLDAIKKDYDAANARLMQIDRRTTDIQVLMQQLQQANIMQNPQGQNVALPPPPQYYALQREQVALQAERDQKVAEKATLERSYQEQSHHVIQGTYNNVLTIFDADALPSAPPTVASQINVAPGAPAQPVPTAPAPGGMPPVMAPNQPGAPGQPVTPKPKGPGDY